MEDLRNITSENTEYIPIPKSSEEDVIQEKFVINVREEIVYLGNDFCKYYHAVNKQDGKKFFAIVYERSFMPPIKNIDFFVRHVVPSLNQVIGYGITRLSSTKMEHIVAIVNYYEPSNNLENYVKSGRYVDAKLARDILQKVTQLLEFLKKYNIYCCNINPENIIIQGEGMVVLRETINSYPNFYQEPGYLAPEFFECHRVARFHASINGDLFALGATLFYGVTGKKPWIEYKTSEDYYSALLKDSSHKHLLSQSKVPDKLRSLIRGLVYESAELRWKLPEIERCLTGDKHDLSHDMMSENDNKITFNNKEYSTIKSLLFAFYHNWDEAINFLKDQKIYKWVAHQHISNEKLEDVHKVVSIDSNTPFVMTNAIKANQKITKLFAILDPDGPLRYDMVAISPAMIPEYLHHLLAQGKKHIIEQVIKIIGESAWENYEHQESVGYLNPKIAEIYKSAASQVSSSGVVNGLERFIYSLNPYAKCESPLLNGYYVTSVRDLIISIEHFAGKNPKHLNIDRNIIAFISSRLGLKSEIKSLIFSYFPKLANHPTIHSLNVLNLLQQYEPEIEIPNICHVMGNEICDLMDEYLHSSSFKQEIKNKITEASASGDLSKIIQLFSNQQLFINDHNGYHVASQKVKELEGQIKRLGNKDHIFANALLLGQKTTVFISYILCFIVTLTIII